MVRPLDGFAALKLALAPGKAEELQICTADSDDRSIDWSGAAQSLIVNRDSFITYTAISALLLAFASSMTQKKEKIEGEKTPPPTLQDRVKFITYAASLASAGFALVHGIRLYTTVSELQDIVNNQGKGPPCLILNQSADDEFSLNRILTKIIIGAHKAFDQANTSLVFWAAELQKKQQAFTISPK